MTFRANARAASETRTYAAARALAESFTELRMKLEGDRVTGDLIQTWTGPFRDLLDLNAPELNEPSLIELMRRLLSEVEKHNEYRQPNLPTVSRLQGEDRKVFFEEVDRRVAILRQHANWVITALGTVRTCRALPKPLASMQAEYPFDGLSPAARRSGRCSRP